MSTPSSLQAIAVRSAMRTIVSAVSTHTSIAAAARLFADRHISGAPVVDEDGRPVGVVTQHDLLRATNHALPRTADSGYYLLFDGVAALRSAVAGVVEDDRGRVGDVMTRHIVAVGPDETLEVAARCMLTEGIHRVLVVERNELVGILSMTDVVRALVPEAPKAEVRAS